MITIELLTGARILPHVADLARLRRAVFRTWPYLYDGTEESEAEYIADFATCASSGLVIARDGAEIVGASTCMRLSDEDEHVHLPFREAGFDIERVFYFGESVLLPQYRGQGIGVAFFEHREAHARSFPDIVMATFCSVDRPAEHPLKPPGAVPLDDFWRHRGFRPTELRCTMMWKQVDTEGEIPNTLRFWVKDLA